MISKVVKGYGMTLDYHLHVTRYPCSQEPTPWEIGMVVGLGPSGKLLSPAASHLGRPADQV